MKKLFFASLMVAASIVGANAQDVSKDSAGVTTTHSTTETESSAAVQDGFTEIKTAELPDAVKKSLESPQYKGWIINVASYDKRSGKYAVELKNGADTKKLKFNNEGKLLND